MNAAIKKNSMPMEQQQEEQYDDNASFESYEEAQNITNHIQKDIDRDQFNKKQVFQENL